MSRTKHNAGTADYLTPADVAHRLLVSPITVNQWAKKGWLKSFRTGGGHHRFLPQDVDAFCRERNIATVDEDTPLRILIIDSDQDNCDLLANLFDKLPLALETRIANDGFDAGRLVERFEPHVLILDLTLPGLDIYTLCKRLNRQVNGRKVRIVAMSQLVTDVAKKRILEAGASVLFPKPIDTTALFALLMDDPVVEINSRSDLS